MLIKLHQLSNEVVQEVADKDVFSKKVYESYSSFQKQVMRWSDVSEYAYMRARKLGV